MTLDIAKLHAEGRKFRTVKGQRPVRIICTDKLGEFNYVYLETMNGGTELIGCCADPCELIEPIPIEREGWVVISRDKDMHQPIFDTAAEAERYATPGEHVARITWQE